MSLLPPDNSVNLLPQQGVLNDYGVILPARDATALFDTLLHELPWQPDQAMIAGRLVTASRHAIWYGDTGCHYRYSGIDRRALPWPAVLAPIRAKITALTGFSYNSCLCNLYPDGETGIAWHSDDEPDLGREPVIASLSLGAARRFQVRHKTSRLTRELRLAHGQLIVMHGEMQLHWLHRLAPEASITQPRISLTFRQFLPAGRH